MRAWAGRVAVAGAAWLGGWRRGSWSGLTSPHAEDGTLRTLDVRLFHGAHVSESIDAARVDPDGRVLRALDGE